MTTTSWTDLAQLLSDRPEVATSTALAAEDQVGYFDRNRQPLLDRGIDRADGVTTAIALVDALAETGELAYLDETADAETVAAALGALAPVRESGVDLSSVAELDVALEPALGAANLLLTEVGLYALILEEDVDEYPLVVVPTARVSEILEAAGRAGAGIRVPVAPN